MRLCQTVIMTTPDAEIDSRQLRHQKRARRARWVGRLLIPVLGLLVSASLWSDPTISKELARGLEVISQITASQDDPEIAAVPAETITPAGASLPVVSQLPQSRVKVNRLP
jgi:hypothetical protein